MWLITNEQGVINNELQHIYSNTTQTETYLTKLQQYALTNINADNSIIISCEHTERQNIAEELTTFILKIKTHWLPYRQDGTVDDELTSTVKN